MVLDYFINETCMLLLTSQMTGAKHISKNKNGLFLHRMNYYKIMPFGCKTVQNFLGFKGIR